MRYNHLDRNVYYKRKRFRMRIGITVFITLVFVAIGVGIMAMSGVFHHNDSVAKATDTAQMNKEAQKVTKKDTKDFISVPYISQEGEYPTACEVVSSVMLLQHFGYPMTVDNFIDNYLPQADIVKNQDGILVSKSPNQAFIGNPRDPNGYGCYAPVIENTLKRIVDKSASVLNTTGTSIDNLVDTYIKKGTPVLLWASMDLEPTYAGNSWILQDTGQKFTWIAKEHCMVLVGDDKNNYYFNDPYQSNGIVKYDKQLVTQRWEELGKQSVVVVDPKKAGNG